jgi:hypothetical protein
MLTVIDIDEATIEAEAVALKWEREFQAAFTRPLQVMQATMSMLSLPPDLHGSVRGGDVKLAQRGTQRAEKMRRENTRRNNGKSVKSV